MTAGCRLHFSTPIRAVVSTLMTAPRPTERQRAFRTALGAGTVVLFLALVGCSGGSTSSSPDPSSITTPQGPSELQYKAHTDPASPITVASGHRFAIMLPADPGAGWRWVMAPVDTTIVVPLGSEFRDDASLLTQTNSAVTSTTSTISPATTRSGTSSGPSAANSVTPVSPSTTTALPLVQLLSFAGRNVGATTIRFRYEQIGGAVGPPVTVTFNLTVTPSTAPTSR